MTWERKQIRFFIIWEDGAHFGVLFTDGIDRKRLRTLFRSTLSPEETLVSCGGEGDQVRYLQLAAVSDFKGKVEVIELTTILKAARWLRGCVCIYEAYPSAPSDDRPHPNTVLLCDVRK